MRQSTERRRHRVPSQKIMLSKALQKANHAVLLDNAEENDSAMEAYSEACELLSHVMERSSGDEERRKLEQIRNTYRCRIRELDQNEDSVQRPHDKALPQVPAAFESIQTGRTPHLAYSHRTGDIETQNQSKTFLPSGKDTAESRELGTRANHQDQSHAPWQRLSRPPGAGDAARGVPSLANGNVGQGAPGYGANLDTGDPMDKQYIPPPLSPQRSKSPAVVPNGPPTDTASFATTAMTHNRQPTAESTSWLDTIDESAGSGNSSVHSRSSSIGLRRKHIRTGSGATEAEFDAALDAAVEAAYDDGYEPVSDTDEQAESSSPGAHRPNMDTSDVKRIVSLAKRRVHEAEREAAVAARQVQAKKLRNSIASDWAMRAESVDLEYRAAEEEEEEEILEEMTKEYGFEDAESVARSKKAPPRQSDSSGFSGRTWGSSVASMPTSAGTPLSSVAETLALTHQPQKQGTPVPPPATALPQLPVFASRIDGSIAAATPTPLNVQSLPFSGNMGVRDRRLSGQNIQKLEIDTSARLPFTHAAPRTQPVLHLGSPLSNSFLENGPKSASLLDDLASQHSTSTAKQDSAFDLNHDILPSATPNTSDVGFLPPPSPFVHEKLRVRKEAPHQSAVPGSPARGANRLIGHGILKKNFSSSSLKSLRHPSGTPPPNEDSSNAATTKSTLPPLQTWRDGIAREMSDSHSAIPHGSGNSASAPIGASFLSKDIHAHSYSSHLSFSSHRPTPLEPCPESFLLRPFWLMRTIHQAVAHPKGGYVSMRLFMPRDAWRVENVKLKNVDEKVANCDLLTAALLNLSKVDTLDADAVLEEMQAFELLLDQVQGQLGKKLGTEVGVNGSLSLFKASSVPDENGPNPDPSAVKGSNVGSKSYLTSWKKLRSKSSGTPGLPSAFGVSTFRDTPKETQVMRSLPMTTLLDPKSVKRSQSKTIGIGPYAHYMASLARLCEAVQVLDQIARQVEDPGLRHSSKTHVGLELCARHAAEFFAFFVCRFALADIGMIMDKHVKRSCEWVSS